MGQPGNIIDRDLGPCRSTPP